MFELHAEVKASVDDQYEDVAAMKRLLEVAPRHPPRSKPTTKRGLSRFVIRQKTLNPERAGPSNGRGVEICPCLNSQECAKKAFLLYAVSGNLVTTVGWMVWSRYKLPSIHQTCTPPQTGGRVRVSSSVLLAELITSPL
eukprot:3447358-Amphidinium_carterae.1